MPLPSIRRAVRDLLTSDPQFVTVISLARIGYRAPPDVTTPYATIQIPGNNSLSGDDVAWSPLVQVSGWCPASNPEAEDLSWDIAAAAATVLGRARNIEYLNITYSARLIDGPMLGPADRSRGDSLSIVQTIIRAELTVHNR